MEPMEEFLNNIVVNFCRDCLDMSPPPLRFEERDTVFVEDGLLKIPSSVLNDYLNLMELRQDIKRALIFHWSFRYDLQDLAFIWKGYQLGVYTCSTDYDDRLLADIIRINWSPDKPWPYGTLTATVTDIEDDD